MIYVEYASSQGLGTLVEHEVFALEPHEELCMFHGGLEGDILAETITPERYQEFLSIHGSERAV